MKSHFYLLTLFISFATFPSKAQISDLFSIGNSNNQQQDIELRSPYPILFIHGLNSSNTDTWSSIYDYSEIYFRQLTQTLHYNLNRDLLSDRYIDDFVFCPNNTPIRDGDFFVLNFKTYFSGGRCIINDVYYNSSISSSNESGITKQAVAIRDAITRILNVTGSKKVILVGHSMGGLAIREYLQRREGSIPKWWIYPNEDDGHRVIKVATIGTPHLGIDNEISIPPFTPRPNTESRRDMRKFINQVRSPFLYGGNEFITSGFHNSDVNHNGVLGENIIGLNNNETSFNPSIPLPRNINYHYHTSSGCDAPFNRLSSQFVCLLNSLTGGKEGDGVVNWLDQFLYRRTENTFIAQPEGVSDMLISRLSHLDQTKNIATTLYAINVPGPFRPSFETQVLSSQNYRLTSSHLLPISDGNSFYDIDEYKFNLNSNSAIDIYIRIAGYGEFSIEIWNSSGVLKFKESYIIFDQIYDIIETANLNAQGEYYIKFTINSGFEFSPANYGFNITSTNPTNIENDPIENQSYIYPTIANNYINLVHNTTNSSTYFIYDIIGRLVSSGHTNNSGYDNRVDVSMLANGSYFIKIDNQTFSFIVYR